MHTNKHEGLKGGSAAPSGDANPVGRGPVEPTLDYLDERIARFVKHMNRVFKGGAGVTTEGKVVDLKTDPSAEPIESYAQTNETFRTRIAPFLYIGAHPRNPR